VPVNAWHPLIRPCTESFPSLTPEFVREHGVSEPPPLLLFPNPKQRVKSEAQNEEPNRDRIFPFAWRAPAGTAFPPFSIENDSIRLIALDGLPSLRIDLAETFFWKRQNFFRGCDPGCYHLPLLGDEIPPKEEIPSAHAPGDCTIS